MQLFFAQCGHKCVVSNGKHIVNVLLNTETCTHTHTHTHTHSVYHVSLPDKTELREIQKKGVASFCNYDAWYKALENKPTLHMPV